MKAVVTRVSRAEVTIGGERAAAIGAGFLVLLGVVQGDTEEDALRLADKIAGLRVFEDGDGKMGRSLADVGGAVAVVPNFTLAADCRKGRRPDFFAAAAPILAEPLFELFAARIRASGLPVACGVFGADMAVTSENDGPVTLILDSRELAR